ncbi:MAG: NRDE family protein [Pseudomonadota bacterium]
MCLVLLSWKTKPDLPLIIAANRDEQFNRPASPIGYWEDAPDIVGGRDLVAKGTWLALAKNGRFGVITNFRDPTPVAAPRSRGDLIPAWLSGLKSPAQFLSDIENAEDQYAGFNLLFGDRDGLYYFSNRSLDSGPLPAGFYALSNGALDEAWPKMQRGEAFMRTVLEKNAATLHAFDPFLTDRRQAPDQDLPQPFFPIEQRRILSAPFIVGDRYGTRCSTTVIVDQAGGVNIREQHYAPLGEATQEYELSFAFD